MHHPPTYCNVTTMLQFYATKIKQAHPDCGSVGQVPKGYRFYFQSGHMLGLQARSLVGAVLLKAFERQLIDVSLSH